jgi:peptidyl-prolyl cis-trans isomerase SurA
MRDRLIIRNVAPSTFGRADTPVILSEAHFSGVEGPASALRNDGATGCLIGFRSAPTARGFFGTPFPGLRPPSHPSDEDLSLGTPPMRTTPWAIFAFSLREIGHAAFRICAGLAGAVPHKCLGDVEVPAGAEEAAEKGPVSNGIPREDTSGAKALIDLNGFVPGMNPRPTARTSFSAASDAQAHFAAFAAPFDFAQGKLSKSCPCTVHCKKPFVHWILRLRAAHTYPVFVRLCTLFLFLTSFSAWAQPASPAAPVVLDRVVAVVNNQAILSSDIDHEIRLSVLDPGRGGLGVLTPARALDQLIGRALIQQQIRQEDQQAAEPSQAEVNARLGEIRRELPACVRGNCGSDAGWKAFLATHSLTEEGVDSYLRYRLEILRFIEQRFRQGISISPQEIAAYYHDTLLPQYAKGEAVPALEKVSARIQEILLQQHVNALFDDWLNNLRKQGDVEVMDPSLESPAAPSPASPASAPTASPDVFPGGNGEGIE